MPKAFVMGSPIFLAIEWKKNQGEFVDYCRIHKSANILDLLMAEEISVALVVNPIELIYCDSQLSHPLYQYCPIILSQIFI